MPIYDSGKSGSTQVTTGEERADGGPTVLQRVSRISGLVALIFVAAIVMSACTQANVQSPTPIAASPTAAASPTPAAPAATPSATGNSGGTATAEAGANATATIQSQATTVAQAVAATVTVQVQAIATTAALSVQQTATAAAPTPAPTIAAAATTVASATSLAASPSPAVASACPAQVVRGFGLLLTNNAAVATRLGCALQGEIGTPSTTQTFEGGQMIWMAKQIFVLRTTGATWSVYVDNYQSGQVIPTPTSAAPAGRSAPVNSFGFLWEQQPDVRTQVGWATSPEQVNTTGAEQQFTHGTMLWTPDKVIEVLYTDKTWQTFPDTFQG